MGDEDMGFGEFGLQPHGLAIGPDRLGKRPLLLVRMAELDPDCRQLGLVAYGGAIGCRGRRPVATAARGVAPCDMLGRRDRSIGRRQPPLELP